MSDINRKIRITRKDVNRIERSLDTDDVSGFIAAPEARPKKRWFRRLCVSGILILGCLCTALLLALMAGFDSNFLRDQVQDRLVSVLGQQADVTVASARISFDSDHNLALEARNIKLDDQLNGLLVHDAQSIRLGLAPLALLWGQVKLAQIEIEGADISLKDEGDANLLQALPMRPDGLVDFDAVSDLLFGFVQDGADILQQRDTQAIRIFNTKLVLSDSEASKPIHIVDLKLARDQQMVTFDGQIEWNGRRLDLAGQVALRESEVASFEISLKGLPFNLGSPPVVIRNIANNRINPAHFRLTASSDVRLSGVKKTTDKPQRLHAVINLDGIDMEVGKVMGVTGRSSVELEYVQESGKIEVLPSMLDLGGVSTAFNGAFGPEDVVQNEDVAQNNEPNNIQSKISETGYRFELVTSRAISAPAQSSEAPLPFGLKVAGRYDVKKNAIAFSDIGLRTAQGELYGQGSVGFGQGSPEIIFMLRIPFMPISDAKNLWPIDVADGAREWGLKNLFGGNLKDSKIDVSIPAGKFNGPGLPPPLTAEEVVADFTVENTRFDTVGELPPVRNASGTISVRGSHAVINLNHATAFLPEEREVKVNTATLIIPWGPQRPVIAELDMSLEGKAQAVADIASRKPINIMRKLPFSANDIVGNVTAQVKVGFAVSSNPPPNTLRWSADIGFSDLSIAQKIEGQTLSKAKGEIKVSPALAQISMDALIDNIPAHIDMIEPVEDPGVEKKIEVVLNFGDKDIARRVPAFKDVLSGPMTVRLGTKKGGVQKVNVDLSATRIDLPWLGWHKGKGIAAKAEMEIVDNAAGKAAEIRNIDFVGNSFRLSGKLLLDGDRVKSADFPVVRLTHGDDFSIKIAQAQGGYKADVRGKSFDARALIRQAVGTENNAAPGKQTPETLKDTSARIVVNGQIDRVQGFHDESLNNVAISYEAANKKVSGVSLNATTRTGQRFSATNNEQSDVRSVALQSGDAGAILRFLDLYDKMEGGRIAVNLVGKDKQTLSGQVDARDFTIVNEPRLASLVSSPPQPGGKSLNEAVKRNIDVSRVKFERGFAQVDKTRDSLHLAQGVVRGSEIGTTFQGTVYDANGNMSMSGTFMPAYGLNRLFGAVPIVGALLGNGRDQGLIGITYKLSGQAKNPQITINPISAIAPGIFRSIFEFQH